MTTHAVTDETEACARRAIRVLNEALEADPEATHLLFSRSYAWCSEALANHPTIQVKRYDGDPVLYRVRALGIINGMFGILPDGYGLIAAEEEEVEFGRYRIRRFVCTLDTGHSR